eukprot:TRINITY_DN5558_c0_g1_i1.p1 TRINITY_DN5558_c0_g1~~TRINITY_DN5558_c0_g1_i1.p1  ORF type:complete len:226 (+),score=58.82 TRINITY_DN5558_c0_g1_i1:54-731(+)
MGSCCSKQQEVEVNNAVKSVKVSNAVVTRRKLLVVTSSINGKNGASNKLAEAFTNTWVEKKAGSVMARDVGGQTLPHLSPEEMGAWGTAEGDRTSEQKQLAAVSDDLINELKTADVLVLAVSMYNLYIPSTLKTWIDRIVRAGVTFNYGASGPEGLLKDKKVYVLVASGGAYSGTTNDNLTPYVKQVLGFIGLTDVEFIYAEGTAMDADGSVQAAVQKINNLSLI